MVSQGSDDREKRVLHHPAPPMLTIRGNDGPSPSPERGQYLGHLPLNLYLDPDR